jgi:hypothetical protein
MVKFITIILIVILIGAGIYFFFFRDLSKMVDVVDNEISTTTDASIKEDGQIVELEEESLAIGVSVEGHEIIAYHYGEGETELLFVGGIHGGYSWNTVLVAYELMDYLEANPDVIPENVMVTVVPVLNPDGLNKVIGSTGRFAKSDAPTLVEETVLGRFNANDVDLNRNFDCDWQATGKWQNKDVSGGSAVFSEPESQAIRDYVLSHNPSAVIVWYSSAGGVFSSNCHNDISSETLKITNLYAGASGYRAYEEFDFYTITGDMVNWLAKNNIPAISVLLSTHNDVEWSKNQKGVEALLEYHSSE